MVTDCNGNSQCHADYSGHIGYQATRRDLRTLHNENMPGSVHQYVQSDRNPYVEIPLDVHPAEIECADEGYTESGERRKGIVSLIEMYGAKVEGRQYDSPEESCFCISEKQTEHKRPEHQLFLEPGKDASVIKHGECQFCIEAAEERKYKIQGEHAKESDPESLEHVSTQPEKRKHFFRLDDDCRQDEDSKSQE